MLICPSYSSWVNFRFTFCAFLMSLKMSEAQVVKARPFSSRLTLWPLFPSSQFSLSDVGRKECPQEISSHSHRCS